MHKYDRCISFHILGPRGIDYGQTIGSPKGREASRRRNRRCHHRYRKTKRLSVTSCYGSCGLLGTIITRWHHKQMAHALWQQRCLEVASRPHHVGVVDETRRTYRHHGRQRDAPRRIATFRHATLRVAPHRYATLEPLGKPGGLRALSVERTSVCCWPGHSYFWALEKAVSRTSPIGCHVRPSN